MLMEKSCCVVGCSNGVTKIAGYVSNEFLLMPIGLIEEVGTFLDLLSSFQYITASKFS